MAEETILVQANIRRLTPGKGVYLLSIPRAFVEATLTKVGGRYLAMLTFQDKKIIIQQPFTVPITTQDAATSNDPAT